MLTAGSAKSPPPRSLAQTGRYADRVCPRSEGAPAEAAGSRRSCPHGRTSSGASASPRRARRTRSPSPLTAHAALDGHRAAKSSVSPSMSGGFGGCVRRSLLFAWRRGLSRATGRAYLLAAIACGCSLALGKARGSHWYGFRAVNGAAPARPRAVSPGSRGCAARWRSRRRGIGSGQARLIPIFELGTPARKKHLVLNAPCRRLLGTPHSEKPCCVNERLGLF